MKYETPQLTPLGPAINATQAKGPKLVTRYRDTAELNEHAPGYEDWE